MPLDFAPTALQPLIRHNGVTDRRRWESALFLKVRDEIQTGNLAIDGAKNFGRFEAFFLPTAQWEQVREFILLRNGAANWLSPVCRTSAVCSKRALFTAGLAGSAHGRGGIG